MNLLKLINKFLYFLTTSQTLHLYSQQMLCLWHIVPPLGQTGHFSLLHWLSPVGFGHIRLFFIVLPPFSTILNLSFLSVSVSATSLNIQLAHYRSKIIALLTPISFLYFLLFFPFNFLVAIGSVQWYTASIILIKFGLLRA